MTIKELIKVMVDKIDDVSNNVNKVPDPYKTGNTVFNYLQMEVNSVGIRNIL